LKVRVTRGGPGCMYGEHAVEGVVEQGG
jgi:hypothetical protein